MKKYLVFRMYKSTTPDVAFMSDDLDRAKCWAEVMHAEENRDYAVVSVTELLRLEREEDNE